MRLGAGACARQGQPPVVITGYLGNNDAFDEAMGNFAVAYADQAERYSRGPKGRRERRQNHGTH